MYFKLLEKQEQTKHSVSKGKFGIKISTEINEMKYRRKQNIMHGGALP